MGRAGRVLQVRHPTCSFELVQVQLSSFYFTLPLCAQIKLEAERARADQAENAASNLQRKVADGNATMADQQGLLEKVGSGSLLKLSQTLLRSQALH